jgi:hypothetical protein
MGYVMMLSALRNSRKRTTLVLRAISRVSVNKFRFFLPCPDKPTTSGVSFGIKIGYCQPVGAQLQRLQVPPDQSRAGRSVEKSAGKPGNGSPKPDGSRMQALY